MDTCVFDPSHGGYVSLEAKQQDHITISRSPSPTISNDDIFSITSEASSQSSQGDSDEESYHAFERKVTYADQTQPESNFAKPCLRQKGPIHVHPRRISSSTKAPPSLPRQDERKVLFVNDLVDSATSLVSVIWPLSGSSARNDNANRGVLPLRRYIEETLRRSRTSYSTLQVALYYLILIKPHVPRHDSTVKHPNDCNSTRAMQCGRRMFLAALILASKYLQDRNYSAKAWSKMSGLKTTEINGNERMFLSAVSWKLHIPEHIFKRWTDIVLRFTAPPTSPLGAGSHDSESLWAQVTPLLTPELDDPRVFVFPLGRPESSGAQAPTSAMSTPNPTPVLAIFPTIAISRTNTPCSATIAPRFLDVVNDVQPPTPGLARLGPLPTPQMTPASVAASTPAVSTCGGSRRSSMSMAIAQANLNAHCRIASDRRPTLAALSQRSFTARYPSLTLSTGSFSSPESLLSDPSQSSRSSRSSSISSISTSETSAPRVQRGQANGHLGHITNPEYTPSKALTGTAEHPITILEDADLSASPTEIIHLNLDDASVITTDPNTPLKTRESRKRCRSRPTSTVDLELQDHVRELLRQTSNLNTTEVDPNLTHAVRHGWHTRNATQALGDAPTSCPLRLTKMPQPPASLRRNSAVRIPVVNMQGNKRVCSTAGHQMPGLDVEVNGGVWRGLN